MYRLRERGKDGEVELCFLDGMAGGGDGEVGEVLSSPLCINPNVALGDSGTQIGLCNV